ncbi:DNA polymerase IV [Mycoplasma sp. Mirounga ES2805-ORL]|uniref:Y-family DNA polymerase n=1 Tax=Mycoplasma sp. Mirounga ES2805-ORL TaxID=754514 RepID=UPI00197C544C|nr:DNA polymerase IV [Mycoplasma sp. Mirounga ES2805-ORL]QSF13709.1 DNA polymerase IV [Mycoplasma sp. Mirounga ES2805-ORL]
MNNKKIIFHIDFDSYFCSAHRSLNSDLDNKPLAIGKNLKRSIASSISYELKNKGAKVGWPNYKILEIEPKTIFIKPNFDLYVSLSNRIFDYIAKNYSKNIQVFSIDECWVDVTSIVNNENLDPKILALKIQREIMQKFRIPLSIGISYNKFLAKMGTNFAKPYGVKIIDKNELVNEIWPLPIIKYFGIGEPTKNKLNKIGIQTIKDLAKANKESLKLKAIFGSKLGYFVNEANGISDDIIHAEKNELKSIGRELTFLSYDLSDTEEIVKILSNLVDQVCLRAKNRNMLAGVVTVLVRNTNKHWNSKQKKLVFLSRDPDEIYKVSYSLFNEIWDGEMIRGIGVRLTNLKNEFLISNPISLFEKNENKKNSKIERIIKNTNNILKSNLLKTGTELEKDKVKEKIQMRYLEEDTAKKGY